LKFSSKMRRIFSRRPASRRPLAEIFMGSRRRDACAR
jgi:hypothetical protein